MFAKKRFIFIFVLVVFVYAWYFFLRPTRPLPTPIPQTVQNNVDIFIEPEDGREPILNSIRNAKKEILVEVYLLSDKEIISSLEDAEKRGVGVNVMLEKRPFGAPNLNNKTFDELKKNGVNVSWTNPDFSLTHEKAIIIDGNEVFILTQNLTAAAFLENREYDVLDKNLDDVNFVRQMFLDDWQRNIFNEPQSANLIESPDSSRNALENLLKSARKEVDIEMEAIGDDSIVSLLKDISKRIDVEILLPKMSQISSNKAAVDELKESAHVRFSSHLYMHAKMILVDDEKAYIGSINLTSQSMDRNRELGIILSNQNSISKLEKTFATDWNVANEK